MKRQRSMCSGFVNMHMIIGCLVPDGDHALRTKNFEPLIVSINSLAAVVDGSNGAVLKTQSCYCGVPISHFTEYRIDQNTRLGEYLFDLGAYNVPAHIKIVDGHVQEHSARRPKIIFRRRRWIATSNTENLQIANFAGINHLVHFGKILVKA